MRQPLTEAELNRALERVLAGQQFALTAAFYGLSVKSLKAQMGPERLARYEAYAKTRAAKPAHTYDGWRFKRRLVKGDSK